MTAARRLHPSLPAIAFVTWWIVAAIVFPERMLNADGDMLRHITHGSWMLEHGRLITADPFSYTRGGEPFVAFEYGSQLFYALAFRFGGLAGVAIAAGLLIAASYALISSFLLSRKADALLGYLCTVAAAVLGAVHWVPRPHLFTLLAVVAVLWLLEDDDSPEARPPVRRLALTALLFAAWANLHGGFVFALILLALYCAGSLLEMLIAAAPERGLWRARASRYAALGATGLAASLLTPHGIRLHQHIIDLLGNSYLLANTQEFQSPDFQSTVGKLFLAGLLVVVAALALAPARPDWRRLLLFLVMIYFAMNARRNIQLFGATVFPILALHLDPWWRRMRAGRRIREIFNRDAAIGRTGPYVALVVAVALVLAAAHGRVAGARIVPDGVSAGEFPVNVVRRARADGVTGRIFHDFIWGGYLLQAWPEQKVFIDGGTDFYGGELVATYLTITEQGRGWRDSLARWDVSLVLLPTGSGVLRSLAVEDGWGLRYCDRTATMLQRGAAPAAAPDALAALKGCYDSLPPVRAAAR